MKRWFSIFIFAAFFPLFVQNISKIHMSKIRNAKAKTPSRERDNNSLSSLMAWELSKSFLIRIWIERIRGLKSISRLAKSPGLLIKLAAMMERKEEGAVGHCRLVFSFWIPMNSLNPTRDKENKVEWSLYAKQRQKSLRKISSFV